MREDVRSFARYAKRFVSRFLSGAAWGRDQLIGALTILTILIYQVWNGDLTVAKAQSDVASNWSVLKPHLVVVGFYLAIHAILTASRLDVEREAEAGLPVRARASFGDTKDLVVAISNAGPTDVFDAEISQFYGCDDWIRDAPLQARWKDGGTNGRIEIPSGQTRFIHLLAVPEDVMDDKYPTVVVFASGSERILRCTFGRTFGEIEPVGTILTIKSAMSGVSKSVSIRVHVDVQRTSKKVHRSVCFDADTY